MELLITVKQEDMQMTQIDHGLALLTLDRPTQMILILDLQLYH